MKRIIGTPGVQGRLLDSAAVLGAVTGLAQAAQLTAIAESPPRASRAGWYMLGATILG